jgi:c-di-GMP-binding flagellar brake protein YcgR
MPAIVHAVHRDGSFGPPLTARVLDLSASGSRVVLESAVIPQSAVCLRIGEGGDILELSATAAVVRLDRPSPGSVTVALEFTALSRRDRVELSRRVLALARRLGQGAERVGEP